MNKRIFFDLLRPYATVSLIGMCKNAGKTTVLGRCVAEHRDTGQILGLTSIGRDGEAVDLVTKTAKPGIYVHSGTLIATASKLLPYCDISKEILECSGLSTPMGEVVILRARSDGYVQLGGPSTVAGQIDLRARFFRHGAQRVFIDGALGRKTLCTRALSDAAILCTGASLEGGMDHVVEETAYFCELAALPVFSGDGGADFGPDNERAKWTLVGRQRLHSDQAKLFSALREHAENETRTVLVRGALTDAMVETYLQASGTPPVALVTDDGSKLLISRRNARRLAAKGCRLLVRESVNLVAVTVNPFSAYGTHFPARAFAAAMSKAVPLPVFNAKEAIQ